MQNVTLLSELAATMNMITWRPQLEGTWLRSHGRWKHNAPWCQSASVQEQ